MKTNRNHFRDVSAINEPAARALAAAFSAVHDEWTEVHAALRAIRALTGLDAFGYLSGNVFSDLQDYSSEIVEDRETLLQLRDEAQAFRAEVTS